MRCERHNYEYGFGVCPYCEQERHNLFVENHIRAKEQETVDIQRNKIATQIFSDIISNIKIIQKYPDGKDTLVTNYARLALLGRCLMGFIYNQAFYRAESKIEIYLDKNISPNLSESDKVLMQIQKGLINGVDRYMEQEVHKTSSLSGLKQRIEIPLSFISALMIGLFWLFFEFDLAFTNLPLILLNIIGFGKAFIIIFLAIFILPFVNLYAIDLIFKIIGKKHKTTEEYLGLSKWLEGEREIARSTALRIFHDEIFHEDKESHDIYELLNTLCIYRDKNKLKKIVLDEGRKVLMHFDSAPS
jgi:hypothetical protein